jgi:glycosyltransferase involved in cell wall biosynthesis
MVSQQVRNVRSGVGTYTRALLEGLELRPTVATWRAERDERFEADWIDLGEPPRWDPTPGAFWSLGRRVARVVKQPFDLVHFLDAREAHAWRGAGRLIGTVHDDYAVHAPKGMFGLRGRSADPLRRWLYYRWLARLERRCYPGFDLLLANSSATAQSLRELHFVAPDRIRTISLCLPAPPPAEPRERLRGEPSLLFVGGNYYRKGLDVLLRALPRVPNAHLHVVGRDRAPMPTSDQVTFHGLLPPARVAAMMAGAGQFVMPSRREALGLAYLEAARAGTPVIAGDRGGVRDIVVHEESGLLVPPEDEAALATAIARLRDDPELGARLVERARQEVAARTPTRLVEQTLAAYGREPRLQAVKVP